MSVHKTRRDWSGREAGLDFERARTGNLCLVAATLTAPDADTVPIAEAAQRTGTAPTTLRYYEQAGLIEGVPRDAGGRRRYRREDLDWIVFLTRMRRTGMAIRDLRRYAELRHGGGDAVAQRLTLLRQQRDRVVAQLDELGANLAVIDTKIRIYEERQ